MIKIESDTLDYNTEERIFEIIKTIGINSQSLVIE